MEKFLKKAVVFGGITLGMIGGVKAGVETPGKETSQDSSLLKSSVKKEAPISEQEALLMSDLHELESKTVKTKEDEEQIASVKELIAAQAKKPE